MTIPSFLLWNLVAPATVSAVFVALSRRLNRAGFQARWGVAAGLALGYFTGHCGILGWPPFPTLDPNAMIAWLALAAALFGSIEAISTPPPRIAWASRAPMVAGLLWLMLRSPMENAWTSLQSAAWMSLIGAAVMASWWNLETQAFRIPGPGWMFHLGLVSSGWAAVQVISGGASLGQLDGVLASAALGTLGVIGLRPGHSLSRGGPAVATIVLSGLGLVGTFCSYPGIPGASAALLVLAPWTTLDRPDRAHPPEVPLDPRRDQGPRRAPGRGDRRSPGRGEPVTSDGRRVLDLTSRSARTVS